jgi:hypothetical protein
MALRAPGCCRRRLRRRRRAFTMLYLGRSLRASPAALYAVAAIDLYPSADRAMHHSTAD